MIDYYRLAFETYERETAAAREVIRRAQARLRDSIGSAPILEADSAFNGDPTEPNGAELAVEILIEHPQQSPLGLASAPVAPDDPAPDPQRGQSGLDGRRPTRSESAGSTPAPRSTEQPGSARSDSTGSVGTPTPAPLLVECPQCGAEVKPQGLGSHQRKHKPDYEPPASSTERSRVQRATFVVPPSSAAGAKKDKREINELCPKGCGRRFIWEPSLLSHASSCKGTPA